MPSEELQIGHYQTTQLIGQGGMGTVYLAQDQRLSRSVAIKVIRTETSNLINQNDSIRLFKREAQAIASLGHPHILPLFDFGEETIQGIKITYLIMPYLKDGSLATWLQQRPSDTPLAPEEAAPLISQAASALQHAHRGHIMHLDVKPSNFLLRLREEQPNRPDLLLADFGIARFSTATSSTSQKVQGTPSYMAPEQWSGQPVPASDQYALAVMAYEILTGNRPFKGGPGQLMYQHFHVQPQPPSKENPRIPASVDAVILRALAKRPEERYSSVYAFAQALQQAVFNRQDEIASINSSKKVEGDTLLSPTAEQETQEDNKIPDLVQKMIHLGKSIWQSVWKSRQQAKAPARHQQAMSSSPPTVLFPESRVSEDSLKDFFISYISSYKKKDSSWAEWIKWQLDKAGYSVILPPWGIRLDSNFDIEMQKARAKAKRIIVVLSPAYLQILHNQSIWMETFKREVTSEQPTVLPICVQECEQDAKRLLETINYVDLID